MFDKYGTSSFPTTTACKTVVRSLHVVKTLLMVLGKCLISTELPPSPISMCNCLFMLLHIECICDICVTTYFNIDLNGLLTN